MYWYVHWEDGGLLFSGKGFDSGTDIGGKE